VRVPTGATIVVAPDSLKGSCSAAEAAAALARGVRSVFGESARIVEVPMADGGEGTLDALVAAWHGEIRKVATTDALGRPTVGRIGFDREGRRAIIEAADANGLPAVSDQALRPLDADTGGVGALILAALDGDVEEVLLCLGGSATSDGGSGMLRALGARLLDADGSEIAGGARGLGDLARIDLDGVDARVRSVKFRIACDVVNPLTGDRGAAAVFGPQKGAGPDDVARIDAGLASLAGVLAQAIGGEDRAETLRTRAGLGAAGGLALGLVALFDAELVPGAELVSEAVGLREVLRGASVVITGEGRLDSQSLDGKVVSQVLRDARPDAPVFVIAGSVSLTAAECREAGIAAAFSIARGPSDLAELQRDASHLLEEAAAQLAGTLRLFV